MRPRLATWRPRCARPVERRREPRVRADEPGRHRKASIGRSLEALVLSTGIAVTALGAGCGRCGGDPAGGSQPAQSQQLQTLCNAAFDRALALFERDPHIRGDARTEALARLEATREDEVATCVARGSRAVAECQRDAADLFAWGRCIGLDDPPPDTSPPSAPAADEAHQRRPSRAACVAAVERSESIRGESPMGAEAAIDWCVRNSTEAEAECVSQARDAAGLAECATSTP